MPISPPDLVQDPDIFRLIIESAPNSMIMSDERGLIVLVNAQTERLFGYSRQELIGQPVEILLPESIRARHIGYRESFMTSPQTRSMGVGRDLFGMRKDGSLVAIDIGLNPIKTGARTLILAAVVDISERREMQRKLAQSETLAAVGAMATVMAHEIRNPLGSIVMAAKSLIAQDLTPVEMKIVSDVLTKESQRLNRTLQDFLQYTRPRELKREISDVNRTVTEIVTTLKQDPAQAHDVNFRVCTDQNLGPFPHDADQLRQVLWNLILNAIQAIQGRGRITISTQADAQQAHITVVDSGPGLDASSIRKIFDPFFTTKKTGTGLGLAIARRIVSAHDGVIVADNAPGEGARFRVTLPRPPSPP
ncbi:MAG: ATP-binding protein [Elusimicrobiota bacterium]